MTTNDTKKTPAKKAPAKRPAKAAAKTPSEVSAKAEPKKTAPAKKTAAPTKPTGLEAAVFSMDGKQTGTVALPKELFDAKWNADLVHQVVVGMQANARPTVAHTKFRGEVSGGGKKPWKQKGTGRARHGSRRSPIWVGGGVTHGPRTNRNYTVKINRKMRSGALAAVLTRKWQDGEVLFVDRLAFDAPKTGDAKRALVSIAQATGAESLATKRKNAAIIALPKKDEAAEKSFRNIGSLIIEEVRNLNPVDLMNKKYLVITEPAESLKALSARVTAKKA